MIYVCMYFILHNIVAKACQRYMCMHQTLLTYYGITYLSWNYLLWKLYTMQIWHYTVCPRFLNGFCYWKIWYVLVQTDETLVIKISFTKCLLFYVFCWIIYLLRSYMQAYTLCDQACKNQPSECKKSPIFCLSCIII